MKLYGAAITITTITSDTATNTTTAITNPANTITYIAALQQ